jgi:aldehyde dehydrogenase (NAD+)
MENQFAELINYQRAFFNTGATRSIDFRINQLDRLKKAILAYEERIAHALFLDLGKSEQEIITTEIGFTLTEISTIKRNLAKWSKKKRIKTNLINSGSKSYTIHEPYGATLIIGPWNYPFQLAMSPLVGAIAGGNTVVIKPSELAQHTSQVMQAMITEYFDSAYIQVVQGAIAETTALLNNRFDKIFFTGSTTVGSIVMEKAAKHLTPVILELGGKSPCIVDKFSNLELAVNRIVFGKGINAGQTCVAPDYVLIHEDIKDAFYLKFKEVATKFYGAGAQTSPDFGKIINLKNYKRIVEYLKDGSIIHGGGYNEESLHIDLTLVEVTNLELPIMKEEIFGPVLPIITYQTIDEVESIIRRNRDPLAFYIFSKNPTFVDELIHRIPFGGGCVNDTIMHLTNEHLPFGGRGTSGIGNYHGKHSFDAFTHEKSIMVSPTFFDIKLKYPPFTKRSNRIVKKIMYR